MKKADQRHTPQRQLSHASSRFSKSVTVSLRKNAYPAYLTRWSFHGLFLISNLHDGCTGIPALLRFGTRSIHTTCYHSPRNLPHPRGEVQQTARRRMMISEPLVSSRKRYRLLSGPRCSALTLAAWPITRHPHISGSRHASQLLHRLTSTIAWEACHWARNMGASICSSITSQLLSSCQGRLVCYC
jgi:hypothetical protein